MDEFLAFRQSLSSADLCCFDARITADYGQNVYTFTISCEMSREGDITFVVKQPDSILGIEGSISNSGGKLVFRDRVLAFEPITDGLISPVISPWLVFRALRNGYVSAVESADQSVRCIIDDSYNGDVFRVDAWLDENGDPYCCELSWNNYRFLTVQIDNLVIS